ncbi:MAG: NAD(P)H-dependent oxidoreductase subunit E [Phycisphaerales bacterium]
MAWITKPSGTMKIEKRAEPYLTQSVREMITRDYLPRFETKQGALLPTLHAVQEEHGWLPHQALIEIADFLGLKPADVIDTASFYEEYWVRKKGDNVIAVCRSIACEFCDHKAVTDACRGKLGIEVGETTDDGKFTLIEIECLGSCGTAPVALMNHTLHENLDAAKMTKIIDDAAKKPAGHGHH